jgi:subtilase family serine protease
VTADPGSSRVTVAGRVALPAGAKAAGAVPAGRIVTGSVALEPRQPHALTAFATAVSTPGSSSYGRYLARGAFGARFGATPRTIRAVEARLVAAGLRVTSVSSDDLLVGFAGTATKVSEAFGTHLELYRLVGGRTAFAATSALTVPASIATSVQTVIGLDDVTQLHPSIGGEPHALTGDATRHAKALAPATTPAPAGAPVACTDATKAAAEYGGLTDSAIAHAYGVDGIYGQGDTGAGQTVDLFELEPYLRSDIGTFDTCYFGAKAAASMLSRLTTVAVDGGEQSGPGEGEAELDIQDVSAVAPGAAIHVYEAPNTDLGALDNYAAMVDADDAKVISTSWGDCEPVQKAAYPGSQELENVLFEQAAAQGQSVFAAAGDAGTADCSLGTTAVKPYLTVDDPASQPFVTAVGGLTITDATEPPAEHVWNDGADFGAGGGGVSSTWAQPDWQADSKVPGIKDAKVLAAAAKEAGRSPTSAPRPTSSPAPPPCTSTDSGAPSGARPARRRCGRP